jgi:hypothetical protein
MCTALAGKARPGSHLARWLEAKGPSSSADGDPGDKVDDYIACLVDAFEAMAPPMTTATPPPMAARARRRSTSTRCAIVELSSPTARSEWV